MIRKIRRLAWLYMLASGYFLPPTAEAQSGANDAALSKLTVSSPTASGMAKFTDFPTSSYSGTPAIDNPLHVIKTSFAEVPITLSYHGSGIRVNQNAGSVGLGFTLMATGVINRSIFGLADNGSWQTAGGLNWISQPINFYNDTVYQQLQSLGQNFIDGAPDLYTYNMGSYSGKFIIADSIRQLPQTSCRISRISANEFQIVAPSGIRYIFDVPETSFNKSTGSASTSTVAWYLSKMIAPDKSDSIVFTYRNTSYEMDAGRSFSVLITQNSLGIFNAGSSNSSSYMTRINGKELATIEYRNGSVEFNYIWNTRQDLNAVDSAALLDNILVKNALGNTLKRIGFRYDYFTNGGTTPADKRLRLLATYIFPGTTTDTLLAERYNYFYNSTTLPAKNSLSIDHWGYYNGKSNGTLVPTWKNCTDQFTPPNCAYCATNTFAFTYNGANRDADANYMMAGMLTRIALPTGGQKIFEWEPHQVPNPDSGKPIYTSTSLNTVQAASTSSAYVIDSTTDFYVDPAIYPNGICANLIGSLGTINEDPAAINHAGATLKLYKRAGRVLIEGFAFNTGNGLSETQAVALQAGQSYFIVAQVRDPGFTSNGEIVGYTVASYKPKNMIVGGVRIKKVSLYDHITGTTMVNRYEYVTPGYNALSSGELAAMPVYENNYTTFQYSSACVYSLRSGVQLSSNSIYNIGAGSHVGYSYVKESRSSNDNAGYTIYQFSNGFDDSFAGEFDASWRRGLLLSKTDYNQNGAAVKKLINYYSTDTRGFKHYAGRQVATYQLHPCASPTTYDENYPIYVSLKGYYFPSEWQHLDSTKVQTYDMLDFSKSGTKTTLTYYDNPSHKLPTRTVTTDSKGWKVLTTTKYPPDYNLPGGTLTGEQKALQDLQQKNLNQVIEQYQQKYNPAAPSTVYTLGGTYNAYKSVTIPGGTHAALDIQYRLPATISMTNFSPSAVSGTTIAKDSRYTVEKQAINYDNSLNITELKTVGDEVASYIWDYNQEYLCAIARNAPQNQIAYSSFEADGKGNWTFTGTPVLDATAPTGSKIYTFNGTNNISRSGLTSSNTYVLSYWSKNASAYTVSGTQGTAVKGITTTGGWSYFEHRIAGVSSIIIGSSGSIDELKIYPADAQMTTYTHIPLIGVTTECSNGDIILKYNYDGAGRLISLTDRDGKILKAFDYQYQVTMQQ